MDNATVGNKLLVGGEFHKGILRFLMVKKVCGGRYEEDAGNDAGAGAGKKTADS